MKAIGTVLIGLAVATALTASAQADERVTAISVTTLGAVSSGAIPLSRTMPSYPIKARRNDYHFGRVLLGYDVTADGSVKNVQVLSAYPVQVYTRTAVRAVEQWRYMPGTTDKRMVEFTFACD
jgi:TonB family protein